MSKGPRRGKEVSPEILFPQDTLYNRAIRNEELTHSADVVKAYYIILELIRQCERTEQQADNIKNKALNLQEAQRTVPEGYLNQLPESLP